MCDFQTIYPWLNKSLFEAVLRRDHGNESISVTDLSVQPALACGENYSSQLLRVTAHYKNESTGAQATFPFVVKAELKKDEIQNIVNDMGMFRKEISIFEHILPAAQALLASIGDDTILAPKCYASSEEHSYLIFEDLSVKGFQNLNRHDGLRVPDYRLLLSLAAKWHATTAVLLRKDPSIFAVFQKPHIVKTSQIWVQIIENTSTAVTDVCRELPKFHHLVDKLVTGHSTVVERFCDAVRRDSDSFVALTHGDMWSNNIMYNCDECTGSSSNAILVDFQLSGIAPTIIDIVFALFTSSHMDVTVTDWEYLLQYYHTELSGCLRNLGYAGRIPTLVDLHVDVLKKGIYGAFVGTFLLAVRSMPADANADISEFMGPSEEHRQIRKNILMNPECRDQMEFLLSYCDRRGVFDC